MLRAAILSLTVCFGSGVALQGQGFWDSSFNLSAGMMSGADTAGLGQNKNYGVGIVGAYPIARNHLLVFEGGYRLFPSATQSASGVTVEEKTDGYFGGISYRYRITTGWLDGLYCQGGLRHYRMLTVRDTVETGGALDGSDLRTVIKGTRVGSTKPVLGVGFRFTDNLSLQLNMTGLQAQNVKGESKSGTVLELVLGMHF
jgi:hypothetical protein